MFRATSKLQRAANIVFLVGVAIIVIHYTRGLVLPLAIALFFSLALLPVVRRLEQWGINRILAALIGMFLLIVIISGLLLLVYSQLSSFIKDLPDLSQKFNALVENSSRLISDTFDIDRENQNQILHDSLMNAAKSGGRMASAFVGTVASVFQFMITVPIYMIFMLIYRRHLRVFILKTNPDNPEKSMDIMDKISGSVQKYFKGMSLVVLVIAVLTCIGLAIVGVPYWLFLGILAAFLTVIPYIGVIIGAGLPLIVSLLLMDDWIYPLGVIIVFVIVQILEGNLITPNILGRTVDLNPLTVLLSIIVAGYIAGILGMILAVPVVTILKIVFENIDSTKNLAILLGNDLPETPAEQVETIKPE